MDGGVRTCGVPNSGRVVVFWERRLAFATLYEKFNRRGLFLLFNFPPTHRRRRKNLIVNGVVENWKMGKICFFHFLKVLGKWHTRLK
jgi:hypothetical protein